MIRLKSPKQIDGIREASRLLVTVLKETAGMIEPGITTRALSEHANKMITGFGARAAFLGYMDFPAAMCTSVDQAVIHGIPNDTKLKEGQIVSIDFGVEYRGFYSDSAVTIGVGTLSPEIQALLDSTKESLWLGIEQAKVGKRVNDISRAIYQHNRRGGYGIVRPYCGHGVGLEIHEDPQVPNYVGTGPNPRLKPGMVLAIEPMINLGGDDVRLLDDDWTVVTADSSISAHFEHTIAMHEDHTEVLTRWEDHDS
jgi:methionyl aminopeptidase